MNQQRRYIVIFIIMGIAVLYLLVHYAILMFKSDLPSTSRPRTEFIERGAILDRNGRFLALQIRFADISIWRPSINDIELLSNEIAPILDMSSSEIRQKIETSESNFLYLKRQVDDADARHLSALIEEKKIRGVMVQPIIGRLYPEKDLASQVIGFVGDRNRGLEGIEYAFNNVLDGSEGQAGKGSQIYLTIDIYTVHS